MIPAEMWTLCFKEIYKDTSFICWLAKVCIMITSTMYTFWKMVIVFVLWPLFTYAMWSLPAKWNMKKASNCISSICHDEASKWFLTGVLLNVELRTENRKSNPNCLWWLHYWVVVIKHLALALSAYTLKTHELSPQHLNVFICKNVSLGKWYIFQLTFA